ncbi:MAG: hemerythrin domain-containing protein [SAR202 cluster bacterium]|jgi:hemerythrin-like domain-containing protein|nr:hemerythrin domain-containing protein [SAR202 cluster bacterium]
MANGNALDSPADVMYLIHKALRAEAVAVENLAAKLDTGDSLQQFKLAFNQWASALFYHAEQEDTYMTAPLTKSLAEGRAASGPNPGQSSGMSDEMKGMVIAEEEELHEQLVSTIEDVLVVLNEEIGKTSLITRTQQHLYNQVIALRIAQEDHLDTEEALIMPMVREQLTEREQLRLAKAFLIDDQAQEPRWPYKWIARLLDSEDRDLLASLEPRFSDLDVAAE